MLLFLPARKSAGRWWSRRSQVGVGVARKGVISERAVRGHPNLDIATGRAKAACQRDKEGKRTSLYSWLRPFRICGRGRSCGGPARRRRRGCRGREPPRWRRAGGTATERDGLNKSQTFWPIRMLLGVFGKFEFFRAFSAILARFRTILDGFGTFWTRI